MAHDRSAYVIAQNSLTVGSNFFHPVFILTVEYKVSITVFHFNVELSVFQIIFPGYLIQLVRLSGKWLMYAFQILSSSN